MWFALGCQDMLLAHAEPAVTTSSHFLLSCSSPTLYLCQALLFQTQNPAITFKHRAIAITHFSMVTRSLWSLPWMLLLALQQLFWELDRDEVAMLQSCSKWKLAVCFQSTVLGIYQGMRQYVCQYSVYKCFSCKYFKSLSVYKNKRYTSETFEDLIW